MGRTAGIIVLWLFCCCAIGIARADILEVDFTFTENNFRLIPKGDGAKYGQTATLGAIRAFETCESEFFALLVKAQTDNSVSKTKLAGKLRNCGNIFPSLPSLARVGADYAYPARYVFGEREGRASGARPRKVRLFAALPPAPAARSCTWTIDDRPAFSSTPADDRCETTAILDVGSHKVLVVAQGAGATEIGRSAAEIVRIEDVVVVVLGDSYLSGEGNPLRFASFGSAAAPSLTTIVNFQKPPIWWEPRCHRSLVSAANLAVMLAAAKDRKRSYTLLNFACSGAAIGDGVLTPYAGVETVAMLDRLARQGGGARIANNDYTADLIPSQIESARRSLCLEGYTPQHADLQVPAGNRSITFRNALSGDRCAGKTLPVDIVISSMGINDVRFVSLVKTAIDGECTLAAKDNKRCEAFRATLERQIKAAPALYDPVTSSGLFAALDTEIKKYLNPALRITLPYENPLRSESGHLCDDFAGDTANRAFINSQLLKALDKGISSAESKMFEELVLSHINSSIFAFSQARGWRYVTAPADQKRRGYCANRPWYLNYGDSIVRQGFSFRPDGSRDHSYGAIHPNVGGHLALADRIVDLLIGYRQGQ